MQETNAIEEVDVALGAQLASKRDEPVVKAAAEVGKLGDQEPLYAAAAVVILVGFVRRDQRMKDAGLSILAAVGVADLTKRMVKKLVKRTRPHVLFEEGRYESEAEGSGKKPEQSFPSGHTAGTMAAARALCRFYPAASRWTTLGALIIGLARLAKGAHWPLDVAAGYVIGWAAEAVSCRLLRGLRVPQPGCGSAEARGEED